MTKKSKHEDEEVDLTPEAEDAKDTSSDESGNDSKDSVDVQYINPQVGLTTRTFTKELNGKHFRSLAESFSKKFNGQIEK